MNNDGASMNDLPAELRSALGEAGLRDGLRALAFLIPGQGGLDDVLTQVATAATLAVPGADGVGVTLLRKDRPEPEVSFLAASHPFVYTVDEVQYEKVKEGPCISAAQERRTMISGSLGGEKLWPRFGPRAGRLGVHSALSVPLFLSDRLVGTLNVYAHGKDAFDTNAAQVGETFASYAAVAVENNRVLAQALALVSQLETALTSRPVIDQAIGMMRGRTGGSADSAMERLRKISQGEHTKLAKVAQAIVDEGVRRADARHRGLLAPMDPRVEHP